MARVMIGGVQRQKPLEDGNCLIQLLQSHQAGAILLQCARLRFQQRTAQFEMLDRGSAIAAFAKQNRQHGMAGRITGTQLQHML